MTFLKNLFGTHEPVATYDDFWNWFQKNEKAFHKVVRQNGNIEKDFFNRLSPKLNDLREGFFYLTGMYNDDTVELIITAEGTVKNIVFVEELVGAAPKIEGWRFTPLKPPLDIKDVSIEMDGCRFNRENISFYSNDHLDFPDQIDITFVHDDLREENKSTIMNGTYIFLDNYLGELNFATTIDNLSVIGKKDAQKELVPIEKLKDFLVWRQKEFVEKYEGLRYHTEKDRYAGLEAQLENGQPLVAIVNTDLLEWDSQASHPWILNVELRYNGEENNGMPDEETHHLLEEIEGFILDQLRDFEGYLNIGRQTADNVREVYFACSDFRKPSKVAYEIQGRCPEKIEMDFDLYKDKYWHSFNRFKKNV